MHHTYMVCRRGLYDLISRRFCRYQFPQFAGYPKQLKYARPPGHTRLAALVTTGTMIELRTTLNIYGAI